MSGSGAGTTRQDVRYEPHERPPLALSAGLGLQYAILSCPGLCARRL